MPVRVVLNHPRRHDWPRVAGRGSVVLGAILLVIGALWLRTARPDVVERTRRLGDAVVEVPTEVFAYVFTMLLILPLVSVLSWGLRLAALYGRSRRGPSRRGLVLFLRRFRLSEATNAVTFAISGTLRHHWSVITLDDGSVTPIKASALLRGTLRSLSLFWKAGEYIRGVSRPLRRGFSIYCKVAVYGAALILVIELAQTRNFTPYAAALERASSGRAALIEGLRFDLPGAFAALLVPGVALVEWIVPYARAGWAMGHSVFPPLADARWWAAIALLLILFYIAWGFIWIGIGSSSAWLRTTSYAGDYRIQTPQNVDFVVGELKSASRVRSGPRLSIARVDGTVWRQAVSRFVNEATVTVLDVSEPTDHILWEIEELTVRQRRPCVFVGHYDRVVHLAEDESRLRGIDRQLARLLDGRQILAYTTEASGLRRFARALRNALRDPALRPIAG